MEVIQKIIQSQFGKNAEVIENVEGGNINSVFSFVIEQNDYIIRFNFDEDAFKKEVYISNLLTLNQVSFPKILQTGKEEHLAYGISEKINGSVLADFDSKQRLKLLPSLIEQITKLNQIPLGNKDGFGFLKSDGNGSEKNWETFLLKFFNKNQTGTFWDNWYELFETSFLEQDVFFEIYKRLLKYNKYNAPHRFLVHGDFHEWNIISDGCNINGIIDAGNFLYGDFVIDFVTIEHIVPNSVFEDYYVQLGIPIVDFNKRLIGAKYFKGLDSLRFYAKMGWEQSYFELRDKLLALPK